MKKKSRKTTLVVEDVLREKNSDIELSETSVMENLLAALKNSEELNQNITTNLPVMVLIHQSKKIVYVNQEVINQTGYTKEEALNFSINDFLNEEDKLKVADIIKRRIGGENVPDYEVSFYKKDKSRVFVMVRAIIIQYKNAPAFLIVLTDITDQKKVEEELKASEEKYRLLIENQGEGVAIVDLEEMFIFTNRAAEQMFGVPAGGLMNRRLSDFVIPEQMPFILNESQKRMRGEKSTYEVDIVTPLGKEKSLLVTATPQMNREGLLTGTFGVFRDITERKKAEDELNLERLFSKSIIESLPGIFYLHTYPEGKLVLWNKQHETIFGFTAENIQDRNFFDWHTPESKQTVMAAIEEKMRTGHGSTEGELLTKDGRAIPFYLTGSRFEAHGQQYLLGIGIDITERKLAERKIQSLLDEKDLILQEVHHRIKNNMNTINALLTLHAETLQESAAIDALKDASSRVQSMALLYDKLYQTADFKAMSLAEYISPLVEQIIGIFPHRGTIKVKTDLEDIPLSTKKLSALGIIINELLTNIMKYAFEDREEGIISVSATAHNNKVCIIIQDNGNGIPDTIDFEKTSGFGLMLVGLLTKQIDGTIRIERKEGTTIVLEFQK